MSHLVPNSSVSLVSFIYFWKFSLRPCSGDRESKDVAFVGLSSSYNLCDLSAGECHRLKCRVSTVKCVRHNLHLVKSDGLYWVRAEINSPIPIYMGRANIG